MLGVRLSAAVAVIGAAAGLVAVGVAVVKAEVVGALSEAAAVVVESSAADVVDVVETIASTPPSAAAAAAAVSTLELRRETAGLLGPAEVEVGTDEFGLLLLLPPC